MDQLIKYAGNTYSLLEILSFTDTEKYFKLKDISSGRIIFLLCVEF